MYFVACNGESWTPEVGTMNLDHLYYTAVDLLETHADEQWVKDLLQFWKESVVLFFFTVYFIDCSSETPGLMQGHPSKRRRIATNSTASDSEDDMDDFFGNDSEEMQGGSGHDRSTMDRESNAPAGSINDPTSTMRRESNTGNTTGPSSTGGATAAAAESDSTCGTAAAGSSSTDGAGQGRQAGSADMQLGGTNGNGNGDDEDDDEDQPRRRHRLDQQGNIFITYTGRLQLFLSRDRKGALPIDPSTHISCCVTNSCSRSWSRPWSQQPPWSRQTWRQTLILDLLMLSSFFHLVALFLMLSALLMFSYHYKLLNQ